MILKESETVELKTSKSELKEAIISIVAILNKHKKGELYFGIDKNGKPIKQTITEKTLRDISQAIANHIEPKIYPEIKIVEIDNIECINLSFKGSEMPYFAYGRAYIRIADEDKVLSSKELENIFLRKEQMKWDSKVSDCTINDIDDALLTRYIEKANNVGRINFKFTDISSVLSKLHLLKNEKPINAAKVIFSKEKPLEVQAAVFAGTDKTTFLDIKQQHGNIFELLEYTESYIKERINWRADLTGSKRIEIPEIPIRALKETLVNSFCHRDFNAPESNKVAIYKDRIEIWNPGNFPEGYNPEDFITKETPSMLRNPTVSNVLYLSSDIEKWGSGIKRIYDECIAHNVKVSFNVLKYGFSVVFYRDKTDEYVGFTQIRHKSGTNRTQIGHKSDEASRQKWILNHLRTSKIIKTKEIIREFDIVKDTASRDINTLLKQNKIIKKGAGNNVWYELKDKE